VAEPIGKGVPGNYPKRNNLHLEHGESLRTGYYILQREVFTAGKIHTCRSQWPRGLRRGSTAARLLGFWGRIPPGAWMSVCVECCQVEVCATG